MGSEKTNIRQRKKSDKSNEETAEVVNKDQVSDGNSNTKQRKQKKPASGITSYRIWTRLVIVAAVLLIAYFTSNKNKERKFATRRESIILRAQNVDCATNYINEISEYTGCVPNKCGRFVTDSLVTDDEANALIEVAQKGLSFGGGDGGVSILDLHSGALSKGSSFINIYNLKEAAGFITEDTLKIYKSIRLKISKAIADKFAIDTNAIYLTHPTFISRIDNSTAKNVHDEYWHPHVDKETYSSFHYTSLLYLNDYRRDFDGGRFIFIDENEADNRTTYSSIEPKKGRVSVFTSGGENLHHIEQVTTGTRYAMTISFTCNRKYAISDPQHRQSAQM